MNQSRIKMHMVLYPVWDSRKLYLFNGTKNSRHTKGFHKKGLVYCKTGTCTYTMVQWHNYRVGQGQIFFFFGASYSERKATKIYITSCELTDTISTVIM